MTENDKMGLELEVARLNDMLTASDRNEITELRTENAELEHDNDALYEQLREERRG